MKSNVLFHSARSLRNVFQKACLCLLLMIPCVVFAQSKHVTKIIDNNELKLTITSSTESAFIVGQKVKLTLELLTAHNLESDMQATWPKLESAIVLPDAENLYKDTRDINGIQWQVQYKELIFYPLVAERFLFPAIAADFVIRINNKGIYDASLATEPFAVNVYIPAALKKDPDFLVTPEFNLTVDTRLDKDPQTNLEELEPGSDLPKKRTLALGDSITETITISAVDVPAMMLPNVLEMLPATPDGISRYHQQATLKDEYVAKQKTYVGLRTQTLTYMVESADELVIPKRQFIWWDINTGERKLAVIPARRFKVNPGGLQLAIIYAPMILMTVGILLLMALCVYYKRQLVDKFHALNATHYKQTRAAFYRAMKQTDYPLAHKKLLELVILEHGIVQELKGLLAEQATAQQTLNELQQRAFADKAPAKAMTKDEAKCLVDAVRAQKRQTEIAIEKQFAFN